jgi:hypothetical protein
LIYSNTECTRNIASNGKSEEITMMELKGFIGKIEEKYNSVIEKKSVGVFNIQSHYVKKSFRKNYFLLKI